MNSAFIDTSFKLLQSSSCNRKWCFGIFTAAKCVLLPVVRAVRRNCLCDIEDSSRSLPANKMWFHHFSLWDHVQKMWNNLQSQRCEDGKMDGAVERVIPRLSVLLKYHLVSGSCYWMAHISFHPIFARESAQRILMHDSVTLWHRAEYIPAVFHWLNEPVSQSQGCNLEHKQQAQ